MPDPTNDLAAAREAVISWAGNVRRVTDSELHRHLCTALSAYDAERADRLEAVAEVARLRRVERALSDEITALEDEAVVFDDD